MTLLTNRKMFQVVRLRYRPEEKSAKANAQFGYAAHNRHGIGSYIETDTVATRSDLI
jgi:hypothetical protein